MAVLRGDDATSRRGVRTLVLFLVRGSPGRYGPDCGSLIDFAHEAGDSGAPFRHVDLPGRRHEDAPREAHGGPRPFITDTSGLTADLYCPFWSLIDDEFDLIVHDLRNHGWNDVRPGMRMLSRLSSSPPHSPPQSGEWDS